MNWAMISSGQNLTHFTSKFCMCLMTLYRGNTNCLCFAMSRQVSASVIALHSVTYQISSSGISPCRGLPSALMDALLHENLLSHTVTLFGIWILPCVDKTSVPAISRKICGRVIQENKHKRRKSWATFENTPCLGFFYLATLFPVAIQISLLIFHGNGGLPLSFNPDTLTSFCLAFSFSQSFLATFTQEKFYNRSGST